MQGRLLRIDWGAEDTPESLKTRYLPERDVMLRSWLHALWLLGEGWSIVKASGAMGVHSDTVGGWLRWYRRRGLMEVAAHRMGGKPSFLSAEQQSELADEVDGSIP